MSSVQRYYVGVDVGTQSVRAGLITHNGKVMRTASTPIKTWNPSPDNYEQSSEQIWNGCIKVIREVTEGIDKNLVQGIGFDATCSLVVLDEDFSPLTVSTTGIPDQNIILWMDHRAVEEAQFITSLGHPSLKFIGGKMSPEMEPPKLIWLKKHMPLQWQKAKNFFDLPDFLTWKATGSLTRSLCSLVCKWMYQAGTDNVQGWQDDFWTDIGLDDIVLDGYRKFGSIVLKPGEPCGYGLKKEVANSLHLLPGTSVATSIIDAHAGGISVLSCSDAKSSCEILQNKMAIISGTSTCHMKIHKEAIVTPGIWGPYFSAMVPDYWCIEAGQSAAGALLDHVINNHATSQQLKLECGEHRHITDILNERLAEMQLKHGLSSVSHLASDVHVWPDYHGNRSPLADSELKGMISGLTLSSDVEEFAKQYLATVMSLAYSTKHIISSLEKSGHKIDTLILCGGLSKNSLYVQMHADVTGLPVIVPEVLEPVLLGAAMLGATASGEYYHVIDAMKAMCSTGTVQTPCLQDEVFHEKKYKCFLQLLECQKKIRLLMEK